MGNHGASPRVHGRRRRRRSRRRQAARAHGLDLRSAPGHARLPGRGAARLPARPCAARRCTWSATSSTAGSCAAPGTGRSRTTTWCRRSCAWRARARGSSSCPATTTSSRAATWRTASAASRSWMTACTSPPTAAACGSRMATCFDGVIQCAKWLAYVGDAAYEFTLKRQPLVQPRAGAAGPAVLEPVALPEAQGQARGQLHR